MWKPFREKHTLVYGDASLMYLRRTCLPATRCFLWGRPPSSSSSCQAPPLLHPTPPPDRPPPHLRLEEGAKSGNKRAGWTEFRFSSPLIRWRKGSIRDFLRYKNLIRCWLRPCVLNSNHAIKTGACAETALSQRVIKRTLLISSNYDASLRLRWRC